MIMISLFFRANPRLASFVYKVMRTRSLNIILLIISVLVITSYACKKSMSVNGNPATAGTQTITPQTRTTRLLTVILLLEILTPLANL